MSPTHGLISPTEVLVVTTVEQSVRSPSTLKSKQSACKKLFLTVKTARTRNHQPLSSLSTCIPYPRRFAVVSETNAVCVVEHSLAGVWLPLLHGRHTGGGEVVPAVHRLRPEPRGLYRISQPRAFKQ